MSDELTGRLVFSKSGRDKGTAYILVGISRQGFFLLADGKLRKIEKPKLKNPKHVQLTNRSDQMICEQLKHGRNPENYVIQNAIGQLLETKKNDGERGALDNAER